jgi:2-aminoadipate transaminase
MAAAGYQNWEEETLQRSLSERSRRIGVPYTGPGAGNDIPRSELPPVAFTAGIPDPATLPIDELAAASETVLRRDGALALEYGGSLGYVGLRSWLAGHWAPLEGVSLTPENYTLTVGSAHALDNLCATFIDPGDVVLVESPSFPGSLRMIRTSGAEMIPLPVDDDGLVVEAAEEALSRLDREGRRAKLLYTIPTYQNPTGSTLALERRHRLLELCQRHGVLIIEDEAYGELSFDEADIPSLYSLAQGVGVAKIGTFSKIIATGLRVGWVQASPAIVQATLTTRFDMGQSPYLLRTIAEYASEGRLDAHILRMRDLYRRKRDRMIEELSERAGVHVSWNEPRGGFFLWLKLAAGIDPWVVRQFGEEEGVLVGAGPNYFAGGPEEPDTGFIRLAYSYASEPEIVEGIKRLSKALQRARFDSKAS